MKRKFEQYLNDILECISKIQKYTKTQDFIKFKKSDITIDAVLKNLLIIGEASSQLQTEIKEKYTNIPWKFIIDFRNVGIHKYDSIKLEIVWDILENELPKLKKQVEEILEKEGKNK